ncbi:glycoside hydrolase family 9 protein [Melioribacter sp. OK-6-Me]|uniref:glycoside hydrolase family 9 protein n=1 Tax=unclassified Melioribacter TaxID=2627329 RepID=UPI003ED8548C
MKAKIFILFFLISFSGAFAQKFYLNDLEYFETRGANVFVFNNNYDGIFFDEKTSGIEIIHHGVRTATGGAVRLRHTPEQWDLIPITLDRKVDKKNNTIDVILRYKEYDFDSRISVKSEKDGLLISVFLDKPLPKELEGHAGFNLEFLPSAYFEKTYLMDGKIGYFPRYPISSSYTEQASKKIKQFQGFTTFDDRGKGEFVEPNPFSTGKTLIMAPEDYERRIKIQSESELMLFDGRIVAQNGWFVVRSLLPAGKTGKVLEWHIQITTIPDWVRPPVIGFSQVGYHPDQEKIAVIELDKNDKPLTKASLFQITPDGKFIEKYTSEIIPWGNYFRYYYVKFNFSSVKEHGLYFIQYGQHKTNPFPIDQNVYANIWHPTLDIWFPVQMDHMKVNEAYRVWHGVPYLDDALQAPPNHKHFDLYAMGDSTDTKYKPLQRIPGLAVGGWFDAGDFDIETGSHTSVILSFVDTWEKFKVDRDQTYIDQSSRYVDIHRPDGKPDLLQQIEHGVLNLVAQVKNIGHPARGINVSNLHQYHHLGDASTITDNLPYNPNLKPYESDGTSSGTMDDRWAFTMRNPFLDYQAITALAAASRALKDFNPSLANDCLTEAKRLWDENKNKFDQSDTSQFFGFRRGFIQIDAALQLYITTREEEYATKFKEQIWQALNRFLPMSITPALQACPYMDDEYKNKLKDYVVKYKEYNDGLLKENPYGVPSMYRNWGINPSVINWGITNYYAHKYYPEIFGPEYVFRALNYLFGCHPYSNVSFVATVGVKSKRVMYSNNRADFGFIAGGVTPGLILLKPDFLENKDDWPFLWGENECTISGCAAYILLGNAINDIVKNK